MQFEIGLTGLGLLLLLSIGFGIIVQLIAWRATTHWLWLIGAVAYFIGGLFVSEVMFGTYTVDELQPIIDGLSFDEALLGGLVFGLIAVLVTWYVTRRQRLHHPMAT
jgi:hypothetical protein